ncbi:MAG TPA: hypothetical protein VN969_31635 [Streptosporangiaceae bacterium]|nr:hypothetical protein [Streptosporangiaceae bacterium]
MTDACVDMATTAGVLGTLADAVGRRCGVRSAVQAGRPAWPWVKRQRNGIPERPDEVNSAIIELFRKH